MNASIIFLCLSVCVAGALTQPGVPGGLTEISHLEARPIAEFAVRQLGPQYSLMRITRKQSQVVQGLLYHLTLLVNKRQPFMGTTMESCDVQVYVVPWMQTQELIRRTCTQISTRGQGNGYARRG